jgi:putative redox protein
MAPNTEKLFQAHPARPPSPRSSWPADRVRPLRHCFTCSKDTRAAAYVAAALAERGIARLRFDFTGLGGSGGDFANTNFSSNVADLVAAADFLRRRYRAPEMLVGHSLGGAAVLAAARQIPEVVGVATIAAPFEPAHVLALIPRRDDRRTGGPRSPCDAASGSSSSTISSASGSTRRSWPRQALLVMHSPRDADGRDRERHASSSGAASGSFSARRGSSPRPR